MGCVKNTVRSSAGPELASRPKGILDQDHRQLEHRLEVVALVLECLPPSGVLTPSLSYALSEALDYFAQEASWHTRDEEQSLFSRLRAAGDRRLATALGHVAVLEQEHVAILNQHELLDAAVRVGLRAGKFTLRQKSTAQRLLGKLQEVYRPHIALEDREVFPQAAAILGPKQMKMIDREITRRRETTT